MTASSRVGQPSLSTIFHRGRYEQVRYADAEPFSDQMQGLHGGICHTPLEMTHVGPVQADREAESFLGVAGFRAKVADDLAEAMEQVG
jgi:hypothetical protein